MGYVEYTEIQVYIGCERDMIPSCLKEKGDRLKRIRALEMDKNVFFGHSKEVPCFKFYFLLPSINCLYIHPTIENNNS